MNFTVSLVHNLYSFYWPVFSPMKSTLLITIVDEIQAMHFTVSLVHNLYSFYWPIFSILSFVHIIKSSSCPCLRIRSSNYHSVFAFWNSVPPVANVTFTAEGKVFWVCTCHEVASTVAALAVGGLALSLRPEATILFTCALVKCTLGDLRYHAGVLACWWEGNSDVIDMQQDS